jgi:hypothetical protein
MDTIGGAGGRRLWDGGEANDRSGDWDHVLIFTIRKSPGTKSLISRSSGRAREEAQKKTQAFCWAFLFLDLMS